MSDLPGLDLPPIPPEPPADAAAADVARWYHERTKHHPRRFAASLGRMDWANQPDPFRRHPGAPRVSLPRPPAGGTPVGPPFAALHESGSSALPPRPLDLEAISDFLYHALALSAWKRYGRSRWSLRVNPSSGNLHPTEGWLVLGGRSALGDEAAVHHYRPDEHALERRATWPTEGLDWRDATGSGPDRLGLVGLTSIVWREAWKYGERAWRYVQHDVGHALAALRIGAWLQGWSLVVLPGWSDGAIARLLGIDRDEDHPVPAERDEPDLLAAFGHRDAVDEAVRRSTDLRAVLVPGGADPRCWTGRAAPLGPDHHDWPILPRIARATRDARGLAHRPEPPAPDLPAAVPPGIDRMRSARAVVRGRRSAVAMDGRTSLPRADFVGMLRRLDPRRPGAVPWDGWPRPARVDLVLYVHRDTGLGPGLYALLRDLEHAEETARHLGRRFDWQRVDEVPDDVLLFRLAEGDVRRFAAEASCGQAIAADGAFACSMIARFDDTLADEGAAALRHLHWETGLVGQVLYLEAEACGIRSTGIGCFHDDVVHDALGIPRGDRGRQVLYHFTIGGAVDDPRLATEPAYPSDS